VSRLWCGDNVDGKKKKSDEEAKKKQRKKIVEEWQICIFGRSGVSIFGWCLF
jgi:hypothetical protein